MTPPHITTSARSAQAGFTLVELMVSLSLFIIVVVALVGSLFTVNDASRKVQAMRTVMDNISFAMETISRNVRTSTDIVCGGTTYANTPNCAIEDDITGSIDQHSALSMHSTLGENRVVEFQWVLGPNGNGEIQKRTIPIDDNGVIMYGNTSEWVAITSPEIDIEKLAFFVNGASNYTDIMQPNVIVKMEGTATIKGDTTVPFAIQTYLSQRTPELPGII